MASNDRSLCMLEGVGSGFSGSDDGSDVMRDGGGKEEASTD